MTTAIIATGFNGVQFQEITRNNEPWIRGYQVGTALGYTNPDVAIRKIYDRHADEFTDSMTAVITLPTPGGPQETRIFSLRGCHLLAMFARTSVAKAFRVWVLDVLETLNKAQDRQQPLLTDSPITPDQQCTLQSMVKALVDRGGIYANIWSRFNNHFRIAKYSQLPQSRMSEAVDYLMRLEIAPKVLPAVSLVPAVQSRPFPNAEAWEAELIALHEDILRQSSRFESWLGEVERRLRNVTGPMFIALTEDIARGTPMVSKERGRCMLHIGSRNALDGVRASLREISTEIWHTTWFATAMKLRKAE